MSFFAKYWTVFSEQGVEIDTVIAVTYQEALKKARQRDERASDVEEQR